MPVKWVYWNAVVIDSLSSPPSKIHAFRGFISQHPGQIYISRELQNIVSTLVFVFLASTNLFGKIQPPLFTEISPPVSLSRLLYPSIRFPPHSSHQPCACLSQSALATQLLSFHQSSTKPLLRTQLPSLLLVLEVPVPRPSRLPPAPVVQPSCPVLVLVPRVPWPVPVPLPPRSSCTQRSSAAGRRH